MSRADANGRHAAEARRRLRRAVVAVRSGVAGWWRCECTAQDGRLLPVTPSFCGPGWESWLAAHPLDGDWPDRVRPADWCLDDRNRFYLTCYLLDQVVERLSAPGCYGTGWVRVAGDGRRLLPPDHGLTLTLAVALPAGVG